MEIGSKSEVIIFYSYTDEDRLLRDRLEKHLTILKYMGLVKTWHNRQINAGRNWALEIDIRLNTADVILLLISVDYLASSYCYGKEMKRALERHEKGTAHVIPIILRPVDWDNTPFSHLQVLPTNKKPVSIWRNRDEAFVDIARSIREVILKLTNLTLVDTYSIVSSNNVYEEIYLTINSSDADYYLDLPHDYIPSPSVSNQIKPYFMSSVSFDSYSDDNNILHNAPPPKVSSSDYVTKYYLEACYTCKEVLLASPNDPYIYYIMGMIYKGLGSINEALAWHNLAIIKNANIIAAYYGKANSLCSLKCYQEAKEVYEEVLILDPANSHAYYSYSIVLLRCGLLNEAHSARTKAFSLNPYIDKVYQDDEHALNLPTIEE